MEGAETTWPGEGAGQGCPHSVSLEPLNKLRSSERCSLWIWSDGACNFSKLCNVVKLGQAFTKANFMFLFQRVRALKPL